MTASYLTKEAIAQNDNNNRFLTYTNPTYGIKMQYPSNWHITLEGPLVDVKEIRG